MMLRTGMQNIQIVLAISLLLISPGIVRAAGQPLSLSTEISKGMVRLGDEALGVMAAPVDTENNGLYKAIAVGGAVGLAYVLDGDLRTKVLERKGNSLDKAARAGSLAGNPFLHLGIAGGVYAGAILADSPKWREKGEMLGEAAILADGASLILKEVAGRGRPFKTGDKGSFRPLQFSRDYDSMPSMHTASSFAMASVLAATSESLPASILYYSAATFVGFSRMYQDKHWASDVVLGAAIGELCGRIVTEYHASGRKVTLAPMISGNAAGLSIIGSF